MQLVCPAGNLAGVRAATDEGADWVYLGLRDDTNARNFAGLNFTTADAAAAVRHAHSRGVRVLLAVNTYAQVTGGERWKRAIDTAVALGIDAVILADAGLMEYAAEKYPGLALHLSVQASATNYEAINFYRERFGVTRAILPRVLSLNQIAQLASHTPVEIEVFGFGGLCVMVEGRCALSGYVTGISPNTCGACSPGSAIRWQHTAAGLESRLNGVLVDRYSDQEKAAYPTLCKGRYEVAGHTYYAIEEPASLNTLELLPALQRIGVAAIKIEGRQRNAAYVALVTRVWREAVELCARDPERYEVASEWMAALGKVSEGQHQTLGAYSRPWQ